ncbi:MAG: hypothetical protein ABEK42_10855, partial [Thiohalorhabdaceae bacterium]
RIRILSPDIAGTVGLDASGGDGSAGAGTVSLASGPGALGRLIIDNKEKGPAGSKPTTAIRHIGRHSIQSVAPTQDAEGWRITVAGEPWESTAKGGAMGRDLTGLTVDLAAAKAGSSLYQVQSKTLW